MASSPQASMFSASRKRGVDYAVDDNNAKLMTDDVKKAVETAKADIISGKVKVHNYNTGQCLPVQISTGFINDLKAAGLLIRRLCFDAAISRKRRIAMTAFAVLLSILAAISIGAMSPGPSFVLVSRIAVVSSRQPRPCFGAGHGCGWRVLRCFGRPWPNRPVDAVRMALSHAEDTWRCLSDLPGHPASGAARSEPLALSGTSGETPGRISVSRAFLLGLDHTAQQPQDLDRLCQHFRGSNAALAAAMAALCPAANTILRGGGLVHQSLPLHSQGPAPG